jgi:hypothetical protein
LRCLNSPAISAPALVASDRSSSSDSSELKSGEFAGKDGGNATALVA